MQPDVCSRRPGASSDETSDETFVETSDETSVESSDQTSDETSVETSSTRRRPEPAHEPGMAKVFRAL
jgi:hypothetical protein